MAMMRTSSSTKHLSVQASFDAHGPQLGVETRSSKPADSDMKWRHKRDAKVTLHIAPSW